MATSDRLVVIGASSGGVAALRKLATGLPADFALPVLIVLHIGAQRSVLPELLDASGPLPARHAVDGERLQRGLLVAPPDHHLLLIDGHVRLRHGPKINHSRPAIDPLFVSAALARGAGVIGVVLTGMLDDGTAGLQAIKRCGGLAVVQDPADAESPSMPLSASQHVDVDHVVALDDLAPLLACLAAAPGPGTSPPSPPGLRHEQELTLGEGNVMEHLDALGSPSGMTCPECHGGLWELADSRPLRLRCHTGHGFTLRSLQHAMSVVADDALWNALRALQEKGLLLERMAVLHRAAGEVDEALEKEAAAHDTAAQAVSLRALLERTPAPVE